MAVILAAACIGALLTIFATLIPGHTAREERAAARAASSPEGARGLGVIWWAFNSTVGIVGGVWMTAIGIWWGLLCIVGGIAGVRMIPRKARAGNWF